MNLKEFFKPKFVRDVIWNGLSTGLMGISGILIIVLIGNRLGASELGVFNQALAYYMLFSLVAVFGIQYSTQKHCSENQEDHEALVKIMSSSYTLVYVISFLLTALIYAMVHFNFSESYLARVFNIMIIGVPLFSVNKVSMAYLNGMRYMKWYAILQAFRWLIILLGTLILLILNKSVLEIAWVFPITELFLMIFLTIPLKLHYFIPSFITSGWFQKHFEFGGKSFLSVSIMELHGRLDIIMIGWLMSDYKVGIYSMASTIIKGLNEFASIIQLNFNPIISKLWSDKQFDDLVKYIKKVIKTTYILYIPLIIIASTGYFLFIPLYVPEFAVSENFTSFTILALGITAFSGYFVIIRLLSLTDHINHQLTVYGSTLLTNFICNLIFIPYLGISGAAISTILAMLMGIVILKYFIKTRLKINL